MKREKTEFHCLESCNKCSGKNKVNHICGESGTEEAETKCEICGHCDYWAYGFFESG